RPGVAGAFDTEEMRHAVDVPENEVPGEPVSPAQGALQVHAVARTPHVEAGSPEGLPRKIRPKPARGAHRRGQADSRDADAFPRRDTAPAGGERPRPARSAPPRRPPPDRTPSRTHGPSNTPGATA